MQKTKIITNLLNKVYYALAVSLVLYTLSNIWGAIIAPINSNILEDVFFNIFTSLLAIMLLFKKKYILVIVVLFSYYNWLTMPIYIASPQLIFNLLSYSAIPWQPVFYNMFVLLTVLFSTIGAIFCLYQFLKIDDQNI